MNWKGQLKKQEETEPQFVDPENQEDEGKTKYSSTVYTTESTTIQ